MMISYVFKVIAVLSLLLSFGFRVNAQVPIDDIKGLEYQIRQCERIGAEPGGAGHKNLDKPNIDGVINPVVWFDGKTENRILYVLKEPWGDGGRNLPQEIKENSSMQEDGWQTYKPMIIITNMICKDTRNYSGENNLAASESSYSNFKNYSGIIEVNKFSGETSSNDNLIAKYARQNLNLLQRQIEVYKPTIVIMGVGRLASEVLVRETAGGYEIFGKLYNNVRQIALGGMSCKHCYAYLTSDCIFIVTYHPSARIKKEIYCTSIYDVVKIWKDTR